MRGGAVLVMRRARWEHHSHVAGGVAHPDTRGDLAEGEGDVPGTVGDDHVQAGQAVDVDVAGAVLERDPRPGQVVAGYVPGTGLQADGAGQQVRLHIASTGPDAD